MAQVIVVGNEKGGSGKTTTTMHLIVSLLKLGFKVGSIDLDSRQQSLTRYIENRKQTLNKKGYALELPEHVVLQRSQAESLKQSEAEEQASLDAAMAQMQNCDFIVIDTPGSDAFLGRYAHSLADTVITPINDSFIDLDLIGNVSAETLDSIKPGIYSAMLWEQKMKRAAKQQQEINWVVVRNRLSTLDAINKRNMELSIAKLAKRFGFKTAPGFGDRVIFKELFLLGLTLHDATAVKEIKITPSVIAARQELRDFIMALNIKKVEDKLNENQQVVSQMKMAA